jgi:hypothetical protein
MTRAKSLIHSVDVREVRESFQRWRSSKKQGREPIPAKLWGMAVKLCETYSINRVARCLGLNHTALKAEANRRRRQHKQAFVELASGSVAAGILPESSAVEYIVEAPDHRQGTPRIHVRGACALEVAALVRALRNNGEAA